MLLQNQVANMSRVDCEYLLDLAFIEYHDHDTLEDLREVVQANVNNGAITLDGYPFTYFFQPEITMRRKIKFIDLPTAIKKRVSFNQNEFVFFQGGQSIEAFYAGKLLCVWNGPEWKHAPFVVVK